MDDRNRPRPQPLIYFLLAILLAALLHVAVPLRQLIPFPYTLTGLVPLLFGLWINVRADREFSQEKTEVKVYRDASVLIDSGPFGFTRNPMYLGMTAVLMGISILLGSISVYLSPILFFLLSQFHFIAVEEKMLAQKFGERYNVYRNRTRRWF